MSWVNQVIQWAHPILSNPDLQGIGNIIGIGGTVIPGVSFITRKVFSHKAPQQIHTSPQKEKSTLVGCGGVGKTINARQYYSANNPILKKVSKIIVFQSFVGVFIDFFSILTKVDHSQLLVKAYSLQTVPW